MAGGDTNTSSGAESTVTGGRNNTASGASANVCGGENNTAGADYASIGGGGSQVVAEGNQVTDNYGTVSGGFDNQAGDGAGTTADRPYATVGGGRGNIAGGGDSTVGGGRINLASGTSSTVGGGYNNGSSGTESTVAGGRNNVASNLTASVGGGFANVASGVDSTVAGGFLNVASGNESTVPGGDSNVAAGNYSFAAGRNAKANSTGCFVWGDSNVADVTCNAQDAWVARAGGGVTFYTNGALSAGVTVAGGGSSWASASDRNLKHHIRRLDTADVLDKVRQMPIRRWRYKDEVSQADHMGPMAQDFHAAFGLGDSDKRIVTVDADGVALAAVQGLDALGQERDARIAALQDRNDKLEARLEALDAVSGVGESSRTETVANRERHVVETHELADVVPHLGHQVLALVVQHPLREDRSAAAHDPDQALAPSRAADACGAGRRGS